MIQHEKLLLKFDQMISEVESFLCSDKDGTPQEGQRILQLKPCALIYNNKNEENCSKNHTPNDKDPSIFRGFPFFLFSFYGPVKHYN